MSPIKNKLITVAISSFCFNCCFPSECCWFPDPFSLPLPFSITRPSSQPVTLPSKDHAALVLPHSGGCRCCSYNRECTVLPQGYKTEGYAWRSWCRDTGRSKDIMVCMCMSEKDLQLIHKWRCCTIYSDTVHLWYLHDCVVCRCRVTINSLFFWMAVSCYRIT